MKCRTCDSGAYLGIISHGTDDNGDVLEEYACGSCKGRGTLRVREDPDELPRESYSGILAAGGF